MTEDFYDLLDIPPDASQDEIKEAYREKVRVYHPDVNDDDRARAQFTAVKKAHEILGDPVERQAYDRLGHRDYVAKRTSGIPSPDVWSSSDSDDGGSGDSSGSSTGSSTGGSGGGSSSRSTGGSRSRSRSGTSSKTSRATASASAGASGAGSAGSTSQTASQTRSSAGQSTKSGAAGAGAETSAGTGTGTASRSETSTGTETGTESGASASSSRSQSASTSNSSAASASASAGGTATGGGTANRYAGTGSGSSTGSGTNAAGGTASTSTSASGASGRSRLADNSFVRWWRRQNFALPLIWLSVLIYAVGLAHFALENEGPLAGLVAELAAVGTDPAGVWTVLASGRHGLETPAAFVTRVQPVAPPIEPFAWDLALAGLVAAAVAIVLVARVRRRGETLAPLTIDETIFIALALALSTTIVGGPLLAGATLMPFLFGVIVRRTRVGPGWTPSYLYVVPVLAPIAGIGAGLAGYGGLPAEFLGFVALPLAGALGLPLRATIRKRFGR